MGDLNACLREADDPFRRSNSSKFRDDLLMQLFEQHDLVSLHTLRPNDPLLTVTKGGTGRTMRDYIIVPRSSFERWSGPKVHSNVDLGSDHFLLTSSCKGIVSAVDAAVQAPRVSVGAEQTIEKKPKVHNGWKLRELYPKVQDAKVPEIHARATELREGIQGGLMRLGLIEAQQSQDLESRSGVKPVIPDSYEAWTAAVHEVLDEVLGKNNSKRNRRRPPGHLTPQVWAALVRRRVAWTALRSAINAGASEEAKNVLWKDYLAKKNTTVTLLVEARRAQWSEFSKEVNSTPAGDRNRWRLLERMCGASDESRWGPIKVGEKFIDISSKDYLPEWEQYYRKLGACKPADAASPQWTTVTGALDRDDFFEDDVHDPPGSLLSMNGPLSVEEVRCALESLPNLKATGADGFSNEVLKALGPEALQGVLSMLWDKEISPSDWDLAILHPLKKVTKACHPSDSRGISLMSCVGKLFESVLNRRLAKFLEVEGVLIPEQGGFWAKRECIEHAVILFETLRRRKAERKETYIGFIDFAKAFDSVWRKGLLFKLHRAGVKGKMLRMIRQLYSQTSASVRVNGKFTDTFPIELGVRQGGVLSPLLFLVFINDLLDRLKAEKIGVRIPGFEADNPFSAAARKDPRLCGLLWADDVALLAESPEELARAFVLIDQWCQDWLLDVNPKKSNVMVVGRKPVRARRGLERFAEANPFMLGGGVVSPTKAYKYLGVWFSYKLSWEVAMEARLDAVRRTIFAKAKVFRNGDLSHDVRLKFFEAVVMPKALWGSELWADKFPDCNRMTKAVGQALRMICFVPPRVSLKALSFELGLTPFTVRVALRRLRILQKWKAARYTEQSSALWARRLLISRDNLSGKSWDWLRKTKDFVVRRLGADGIGLDRSAVMSDLDLDSLRNSASLRFYREWCSASLTKSRTLLASIHENDTELKMSNYLRAHKSSKSMRALLMARCGGLMFQDRISKFERTSDKCHSCSDDVKETLVHWVFECPSYAELRSQLATQWQVEVTELFQREPLNWAALGESPHFGEIDETRHAEKTRISIFQKMWKLRCSYKAQKILDSEALTPGVEAL